MHKDSPGNSFVWRVSSSVGVLAGGTDCPDIEKARTSPWDVTALTESSELDARPPSTVTIGTVTPSVLATLNCACEKNL